MHEHGSVMNEELRVGDAQDALIPEGHPRRLFTGAGPDEGGSG
jgi:hypothetical protein